jgi:sec-independent protein translocase protein TatC
MGVSWNEPQFFEQSGTDPGSSISSMMPESPGPQPDSEFEGLLSAVGKLNAMPLLEHITELRNRILWSAGILVAAIGLGFYIAPPVIDIFKALAPKGTVFTQITMGEVLMTTLQMSVYIGFALAAPIILYHLLRFVLPGLKNREKAMVTWAVIGGTLLFVLGVIFAYFFVVSPAIYWLLDFGNTVAQPYLSIKEFISFSASLLFVTGLMFELPMVLFLLSFTGLITSKKLIQEWRWATIIIFLVAAIVTPTQDPFSMSIVGLAMVALYGLSIIPIRLCGR